MIWWKFFIRLGVLALCASVASSMAGEQYLENTIRSGGPRQFTLQQLQAVSATSAMFGALFGLAGVEFILARHQAKEDRDRMVRLLMAQAKRLDISPEVAAASVYLANDLTEVPNER